MAKSVEIIEVSPRDGIQNERKLLSLDTKLELINRSIKAGAARNEVTSFVNPNRVPQKAEADGPDMVMKAGVFPQNASNAA